MPCVIILRDRLFDIVISTDDGAKIHQLYDLGTLLDDTEEEPTAFNVNIFAQAHEFRITTHCAIFEDEATFTRKFPNREVPMRLTLEEAEGNVDWSQGLVAVGIRYFGAKALNLRADQELVPVLEVREPAKDFNLLKQYQQAVAQM